MSNGLRCFGLLHCGLSVGVSLGSGHPCDVSGLPLNACALIGLRLDLEEGDSSSLLSKSLPPLKSGCCGGLGSRERGFAGFETGDHEFQLGLRGFVRFDGKVKDDAELCDCSLRGFVGGRSLGHVVVLEECCFTSDACTCLGFGLDGLSFDFSGFPFLLLLLNLEVNELVLNGLHIFHMSLDSKSSGARESLCLHLEVGGMNARSAFSLFLGLLSGRIRGHSVTSLHFDLNVDLCLSRSHCHLSSLELELGISDSLLVLANGDSKLLAHQLPLDHLVAQLSLLRLEGGSGGVVHVGLVPDGGHAVGVASDVALGGGVVLLELAGRGALVRLFGDRDHLVELLEGGDGLLVGGLAESFCAEFGFSLDKGGLSSGGDLKLNHFADFLSLNYGSSSGLFHLVLPGELGSGGACFGFLKLSSCSLSSLCVQDNLGRDFPLFHHRFGAVVLILLLFNLDFHGVELLLGDFLGGFPVRLSLCHGDLLE